MEKEQKVGIKYEMAMWHLLVLFLVAVFASILIGSFLGAKIGHARGVDSVEIDSPEYCSVNRVGDKITISCTELEDISATELCQMLSGPIKSRLKVLVIS